MQDFPTSPLKCHWKRKCGSWHQIQKHWQLRAAVICCSTINPCIGQQWNKSRKLGGLETRMYLIHHPTVGSWSLWDTPVLSGRHPGSHLLLAGVWTLCANVLGATAHATRAKFHCTTMQAIGTARITLLGTTSRLPCLAQSRTIPQGRGQHGISSSTGCTTSTSIRSSIMGRPRHGDWWGNPMAVTITEDLEDDTAQSIRAVRKPVSPFRSFGSIPHPCGSTKILLGTDTWAPHRMEHARSHMNLLWSFQVLLVPARFYLHLPLPKPTGKGEVGKGRTTNGEVALHLGSHPGLHRPTSCWPPCGVSRLTCVEWKWTSHAWCPWPQGSSSGAHAEP